MAGRDDEYQMEDLRVTKVTPSDHGLYKCAVEFNGRLDDLNSKAVFVNLKGITYCLHEVGNSRKQEYKIVD